MNINWYSFFYRIRILCIIALAISLLKFCFDFSLGEDKTFGTTPFGSVPYVIMTSIATILAWLMVIKNKSYRGITEVTSKDNSRLYGTIVIVLIASFVLLFLYAQNIR